MVHYNIVGECVEIHIFSFCTEIHTLLNNVNATVKDILGYEIPKECKIMYLRIVNDCTTGKDRYMIRILLMAMKKAIKRNWYRTEPSAIDQWLEIVKEIYNMEKITYHLRLKGEVFVAKWGKWMRYMYRLNTV